MDDKGFEAMEIGIKSVNKILAEIPGCVPTLFNHFQMHIPREEERLPTVLQEPSSEVPKVGNVL